MRKLLIAISLFVMGNLAQGQAVCKGEFPNLITGICYDCMFPITLAGVPLSFGVDASDYDTGASTAPVCICKNNLSVGLPTSFWEPTYMVEAVAGPVGCMPLLGGVNISPPLNANEFPATTIDNAHIGGTNKSAFIHVNEYLNPVMTTLGVVTDSPCFDNRGFDVPYVSWSDPTWGSDTLSLMLTPWSYPFSGIPTIAAEAPDAISATFGFPRPELFWTAGAWGPMYPTTGNISSVSTPEKTAHLAFARLFAKLHAVGTQPSTTGPDALASCGAYGFPQFIMDKRQYKTNRIYPFNDNMCTPISRPLVLQEAGAARPQDRDYGYFIFRKKDCCGVVGGVGSL